MALSMPASQRCFGFPPCRSAHTVQRVDHSMLMKVLEGRYNSGEHKRAAESNSRCAKDCGRA